MEGPKSPSASPSLDRFDIVVDPTIRDGASLVRDLETSNQLLHSGAARLFATREIFQENLDW